MVVVDFAFGLGILLFGMQQLQKGIHGVGQRGLRRWLAQATASPLRSVLTGTLVTAMLQSSSMVSLMVLAFASAGVIPLFNAVGVIIGANLGTTFTGWIVATIGFKLSLGDLAQPILGAGCLLYVFSSKQKQRQHVGRAIVGLALLLLGIELMKQAVASLPELVSLARIQYLPPFAYLLFGAVITAIIQSSSATMMLTLAALSSELIALPAGAAIVIGANLGTTSTVLLGSIGGSRISKQLAASHVLFNVSVDIGAFFLLLPMLPWLIALVGLNDPLYALVAFHSTFNLMGLLVFLPFIKRYSDWLGGLFDDTSNAVTALGNTPQTVPEAAVAALDQETVKLMRQAISCNLNIWSLGTNAARHSHNAIRGDYEQIKARESEITEYAINLQHQPLDESLARHIDGLLIVVRETVYGVKCSKGVQHNLESYQLNDGVLAELTESYGAAMKQVSNQWMTLLDTSHEVHYAIETLQSLEDFYQHEHEEFHQRIYRLMASEKLSGYQASSLLNVNREFLQTNKSLHEALDQWYQLRLDE